MMIDELIKKHRETKGQIKKGGNKKVRLFDDYVLLAGSFKENEIKKVILISQELKNKGVNIVPTLEYQIVYPPNEFGYARGYVLQPRAQGTEIYHPDMPTDEHEQRLHDIANMDTKKIDKFISDWIDIEKAGLMVDPSKTTNFFYHDDGISFIDLNLKESTKHEQLIDYFNYVCAILTDYCRQLYTPKEIEYTTKIITNVAICFLNRGIKIKDITNVLSRGWMHALTKQQIYAIVTSLQQKSDSDKTIATKNCNILNNNLQKNTFRDI